MASADVHQVNQRSQISKGQLVIPKAVRDDAQVIADCGLEVRYVEGEIRLRSLLERPLSSLAQVAACLYRPDRKLLSEADTKAAIRAKLKARHAP